MTEPELHYVEPKKLDSKAKHCFDSIHILERAILLV